MIDTSKVRAALAELGLPYLKPPKFSGGSWPLNPDALADAILARECLLPAGLSAQASTEYWRGRRDERAEITQEARRIGVIGGQTINGFHDWLRARDGEVGNG